MRSFRYPALVGALLAAGMVAACETVPYTGRSQLQFISPQQESELGAQAYQQALAKTKLSSDAAASEMVARVGSRIAAVTGHPEYKWEYRLIQDDKQVNAFALPGGKVAVYTGMLPITRDEDGLAAVLAHEIGHVIARHGGERVSQQMGVQTVTRFWRAASSNPATVQFVSAALARALGRRADAFRPGAGVGSGSRRPHPDGEGRLRSTRVARSVEAHGRGFQGPASPRVPLDAPLRGHPHPADRGVAAGGPHVLPPGPLGSRAGAPVLYLL
jgi:hypothetical protein